VFAPGGVLEPVVRAGRPLVASDGRHQTSRASDLHRLRKAGGAVGESSQSRETERPCLLREARCTRVEAPTPTLGSATRVSCWRMEGNTLCKFLASAHTTPVHLSLSFCCQPTSVAKPWAFKPKSHASGCTQRGTTGGKAHRARSWCAVLAAWPLRGGQEEPQRGSQVSW